MKWWILIIIVGTIIAKIFANVSNYKYDTLVPGVKKKLAGMLQHIFEIAMIGIPFTIGLIELDWWNWVLAVFGFAFVYAFLMSTGFNILIGKRPQYIGFTDPIDLWIRKVFKLINEYSQEFKNLSAKEKQKQNFRRWIVFVIKFVFLVAGYIIIIEFINI